MQVGMGYQACTQAKTQAPQLADPDLPEENVPISSRALLITSKRGMLTASTNFSPQI